MAAGPLRNLPISAPHFHDHFSRLAATYAAFRPAQPRALIDWVVTLPRRRGRAWDCATGNGQAAVALAPHFASVVATDASAAQIAHATPHPRVAYAVAPAERSGLDDGSVDLVTVAQALHWFDFGAFYDEVRRVVAPGGVLVTWSYMAAHLDDVGLDAAFTAFAYGRLGDYWPPERRLIDEGYATIPFPFDEIAAPSFELTESWTLAQLAGYMRSWSATARYVDAHGSDPIAEFERAVRDGWGADEEARQTVRWRYAVRAGRV